MRTCADCGRDISDRPLTAYLCNTPRIPSTGPLRVNARSCFEQRQRAARKANYLKNKARGKTRRERFPGTVGTEIACATPDCGVRFIKTSGNHKFCDGCRAANDAFHDTTANTRRPDRPHGPALNGIWHSERVAA